MVGTNGPCLGCETRQLGCHGKCEKYQTFRSKRTALLEAKLKAEQLRTPTAACQQNKLRWSNKYRGKAGTRT
nr:MAG TPA: hypothetical protein [Caudoviricetes sp.]